MGENRTGMVSRQENRRELNVVVVALSMEVLKIRLGGALGKMRK